MSPKRLILVVTFAAATLVLGITNAEAGRNRRQSGCCQSYSSGRVSSGYSQRYSGFGNQRSYNTTGRNNYRYDSAGRGNYGHNRSNLQSYSHHNYSPGPH